MISPPPEKWPEPKLRFTRRLDKIVELLIYLTEIKPGRDQYQAVKLFYLADKKHFNLYGRPITFELYYALNYGPVASSALDLIRGDAMTLREAGIPRLPIHISRRENIFTLESPERIHDRTVFSRSDLQVFDEIVAEHGDKNFDELYKLTHEHAAYKNAWNGRRGNAQRALMFYEDMLDERADKDALIEELIPVSQFIR